MRKVLIVAIRVYQLTVSQLVPPCCRFAPSCSQYAIECLNSMGVVKGVLLAVKRFWRCHPLSPGGFDPAPSIPHGTAIRSRRA